MKHLIFIASLCLVFTYSLRVVSQTIDISKFPLYQEDKVVVKDDWLVKGITKKSAIYKTGDGYLALSNGLVTRTFALAPNGATIGLDNLITGESVVRSVSPEAIVWVNGYEIPVGGLKGQPVQNYLFPDWLKSMTADPYSMKLVSYNVSPIQKRFEWNRRTEWSPQHQDWPPKGLMLSFSYQADDEVIKNNSIRLLSDDGRTKLWEDNFDRLSSEWTIVGSKTNKNASFENEGKPGEIMIPERSSLYAERPFPADASVVICQLNAGTDRTWDFGPGITLTFNDRPNLRFYLRPNNNRYAIQDGVDFYNITQIEFDPAKSQYLRIERVLGKLICSASEDGEHYTTLATLDCPLVPKTIRVGKSNNSGDAGEQGDLTKKVRLRIERVAFLGNPQKLSNNLNFLKGLTVNVHYEIYDGIPLICKWVSIKNNSSQEIKIDNVKSELLAVVETGKVGSQWINPPIWAKSEFPFQPIRWEADLTYRTQLNYWYKDPLLLTCKNPTAYAEKLSPNNSFESIRLWELLFDSTDDERRGLAERKAHRIIAPWVTENPIMMHVLSKEDSVIREAIDQCADVGFEMAIMSFGSGISLEDTTRANIDRMKELKKYAASKGIAIGGYSLLASRSIDAENDVVMPTPTMKPRFGNAPCLESKWGQFYQKALYDFYKKTGMDILEHDGPYAGDVCASTTHPGHRGLEDSQWKQYTTTRDFYRWCRSKGIYLNVPDGYMLEGSSKVPMGYRETNWSLPREYQEIIERQNVFDGTYKKTSSMGYMFVPLVQYHGGGPAATIEPLKEHLSHYEQRLANLFGYGVQATYRGPRLYDAPETRDMVKRWVDFYKKHRAVLDADIIHVRRPDGRDYDAILHANPLGEEKGLLMVYNPLNKAITRTLLIDLYYTGLNNKALVSEKEGTFRSATLNGSKITLNVSVPAKSQTWFVFK